MMKKNHWLKLDRNFFKRHDVTILREMPEGDSIVLFYMILLAESIDHDGMLRITEYVPYDADTLAMITKTSKSTVELAIPLLKKFGLIEVLDDDTYYMTKLQTMLGKIDDSSERVAKHREKKKLLQGISPDVTVTVTNVTPTELDKELDKELDNTYVEIIEYLNLKTNSSFKTDNKNTIKLIKARLKEKFTVDDFKKAIDNKSTDWMGTDYEQYLVPTTLFGNKFEGYLKRKTNSNKKSMKASDTPSKYDAIYMN